MKKSILSLLCIIMMGTATSYGKTAITIHYDSDARQEMVIHKAKPNSDKKHHNKKHNEKHHIKKHKGQHKDCKKCLNWRKHHKYAK